MASEVSLCNLALSHLGDVADVQSISPPDGSAQADWCAQFYPIARDVLIETHDWGLTTKRAQTLALLSVTCPEWKYGYAPPADMLDVISILDPNSPSDYAQGLVSDVTASTEFFDFGSQIIGERGIYTPREFALESYGAPDGTSIAVIWTNQVNASARYTARVTDPTRFPALFQDCLGWLLASMIAGPLLKGDNGVKTGAAMYSIYEKRLGTATSNDANQKKSNIRDRQQVPWINGR